VWALPDLRLGLGYRTRPIDSHGVPVVDVEGGGGLYFVMTSRLAGFFNLFGGSSANDKGAGQRAEGTGKDKE
jgi:hypothetical protein